MYQCIGQRYVKKHEGDRGQMVRCTNVSETPSNPDKPAWGWLCHDCASAPSIRNSPKTESFNANAAQNDIEEFKDQIDSGFMIGIRGSMNGEEDE